MTLDKNSSLTLLSRTQLLPTFPYLRDILVIVDEKNRCLVAAATTILVPSHVNSRHPRDRQCNFSEGVQEHGEGEQQREATEQRKGTNAVIKWRHKLRQLQVIPNAWRRLLQVTSNVRV
jgi:hypothetical protein